MKTEERIQSLEKKVTALEGQVQEQSKIDAKQSIREVLIKYVKPHKFQVFINGEKLEDVKRFAIDVTNAGMDFKNVKTPTYTVEHYLTGKQTCDNTCSGISDD